MQTYALLMIIKNMQIKLFAIMFIKTKISFQIKLIKQSMNIGDCILRLVKILNCLC